MTNMEDDINEEVELPERELAKNEKVKILVTDDECPPCITLKNILSDQIKKDQIEIIDLESENSSDLIKDEDQIEVPSAYLIKEDNKPEKCDLFFDDEIAFIQCDKFTIQLADISNKNNPLI